MNAFLKIKNLWAQLDDWYENRWIERHCPNLAEDCAQARREYEAGETISWEELKTKLQEEYAAGGAVQNRDFQTRRA